jgi:hypothetical protein
MGWLSGDAGHPPMMRERPLPSMKKKRHGRCRIGNGLF